MTNNLNPLYPKGSTYTLEEFIPVILAAQKMGLTEKRIPWFTYGDGLGRHSVILHVNQEPYTLLQPIQAPYDAPKPLTVEEIKAAPVVWVESPNTFRICSVSDWSTKACAIAFDLPCYATEDDCKRAHKIEGE